MGKRLLAAFLWFYTGWYAAAIIADVLTINPILGPIFGAAAAGVIAGDPRQVIWRSRRAARAPSLSPAGAEPA